MGWGGWSGMGFEGGVELRSHGIWGHGEGAWIEKYWMFHSQFAANGR